jgi:serine/threonine protein kinase
MTKFGRYKLVRLLGAGGMGQVFEAIDNDDQRVAIKVIRGPQAISKEARIRFIREVRATSQLRHPNIVAVRDMGQVRGNLYMVMEYLRGVPLTRFIPGPPSLSLGSKLSIAAQSLDALGYAHSRGIVHRDFKPANVIILADKSVKIVDFGLAELANLSNSVVQGCGTLPYMSPEQLLRQNIDARSDIWSAGVTLFELLTGRLPYERVLDIPWSTPPVLPHGFQLDQDLNAILARALARDSQMRYANAALFGADLRQLMRRCEDSDPLAEKGYAVPTNDAAEHTGEKTPNRAAPVFEPQQPLRPILKTEPESTAKHYSLPNLNFRLPMEGALETTVKSLKWGKKRQSLRQWRERISSDSVIRKYLMLFSLPYVVTMLLGWRFESQMRVLFFLFAPLLVLHLFIWLALSFSMKACSAFLVQEQMAVCGRCRLRMRLTARFDRACKNREDVIFGYRDCLAALKNGLWQDAAKLLSIYGVKFVSEFDYLITHIGYYLGFFECSTCGHHVARLASYEFMEGLGEEQTMFHELHWGSITPDLSSVSFLARASGVLSTLPEIVRDLTKLKLDRRELSICVAVLVVILILFLLTLRPIPTSWLFSR